jgi:hypothetical protein
LPREAQAKSSRLVTAQKYHNPNKGIVMPKHQPETYSVCETAMASGYSVQRIRDLLWTKRVAGAVKTDGSWRIPAKTVEALKLKREAR